MPGTSGQTIASSVDHQRLVAVADVIREERPLGRRARARRRTPAPRARRPRRRRSAARGRSSRRRAAPCRAAAPCRTRARRPSGAGAARLQPLLPAERDRVARVGARRWPAARRRSRIDDCVRRPGMTTLKTLSTASRHRSEQEIPLRQRQHVRRLARSAARRPRAPRRCRRSTSIFGSASLSTRSRLPIAAAVRAPRRAGATARRARPLRARRWLTKCTLQASSAAPNAPNIEPRDHRLRRRNRRVAVAHHRAGDEAALDDQLRLDAEERRLPQHEVGELADLDRADLARRCRARSPG